MKPLEIATQLRVGHQLTEEQMVRAAEYLECLSRIHAELDDDIEFPDGYTDFYTNVEGALSASGLDIEKGV